MNQHEALVTSWRDFKESPRQSNMNSAKIEDRTNIKFMVKHGWKNGEKIDDLGKVYGDNTPKKWSVYKSITRFKNGWDNVKDDSHSRKPATSVCEEKIDGVHALIEEDLCLIAETIAKAPDFSIGSVYTILTDKLQLSKLSGRWVAKLLRPDQLQTRADLSVEVLNKWNKDPDAFLWRIVSG